jgi:hypothetical protein
LLYTGTAQSSGIFLKKTPPFTGLKRAHELWNRSSQGGAMKIQLSIILLMPGLLGIVPTLAQTTATPTISLNSGPYAFSQKAQDAIIEDGTPGASIQWCYVPTGTCSPSKAYNNQPIYILPTQAPTYSETICANATATGDTQSATTCNYYTTWGDFDAPTGDQRQISEPTFPSGCAVVYATKSSEWTNTVNIDPYNATAGSANGGTGTQGTLGATGGSDFEPSAETPYDNSAISGPLGTSSCVELEPSGNLSAFVITPLTIPADKTLVVDAGVTVFMSRDPSQYDTGGKDQCGELDTGSGGVNGNYCLADITMENGSALMGYGRIDFRGWAQFPDSSRCTQSGSATGPICGFYYHTIAAFLNTHTKAEYGMPLPPGGTYVSGDGVFYAPTASIQIPSGANNVVLYKITLQNMPGFGIQWAGSGSSCSTEDLTLWGIKIIDPFDTDNTDGFDPISGVCNFTVRDVYVSNGDDDSAIKSASGEPATAYGSYINVHKYSGLGMSIGSATAGGINNISYNNVFCSGPTFNGAPYNGVPPSDNRDTCIKVKSPDTDGNGGVVNQVTYEGLYMQNEGNGIWAYPYYHCPVSSAPTYTNFLFQDVTLGASPGTMSFQSWDASHQGIMAFNNFTATGSFGGPVPPPESCTGAGSGDAYGTFTVGPNPVNSTLVNDQLAEGTGSTVGGTACTSDCVTPYSATPQPLVGELAVTTPLGTNTLCSPTSPCTLSGSSASITLQATLQAGSEYDIMESPELSASGCPACTITFMESVNGGAPTSVGTATLGGNGITAVLPVTITQQGEYIFTAVYPGDSNYSLPYAWGAVTVCLESCSS